MFLSNNPNFWPILEANKLSSQKSPRKIACWFEDIQFALDNKDFENALLLLICASKTIYEKEITLDDDTDSVKSWTHILRKMDRKQFKEDFFLSRSLPLSNEDAEIYSRALEEIDRNARETAERWHREEIVKTYRTILNSLKLIAVECNTLSMAKAQMKAFEIQQKKNTTPVPTYYQISDIPENVLNALCDLKFKGEYILNRWSKEKFVSECKKLWENCKKQPISLVLLPTLLTILIVEEIEHESVYAYLKQTKKYLSADNSKRIAQLFEDICDILNLGYRDCNNWWIPGFNWKEIEKRFYDYNELSEADQKIAHDYFFKLRYSNGLSKSDEQKLANMSFGPKLQALAKICNLNYFMMLALQTPEEMDSSLLNDKTERRISGEIEPPILSDQEIITSAQISTRIKSAYKLLMEDQILPRSDEGPKIFDSYFGGLYTRLYGIPDFSYIALLRHYRLSIDQVFGHMPRGLKRLAEYFEHITSDYVKRLTKNFIGDQNISPYFSNLEDKEANISSGVIFHILPNGNSEFQADNMRKSYRLSSQIADNYSEDDYREFISNINHFHPHFFCEYLAKYCKKYHIDLYPEKLDFEKVLLENAAFSTIMEFVKYYLEKNFYSYWKDHISKEFGLYDDNAPKA